MTAIQTAWRRWEAFLKLDRLERQSDLLRARVVYGCAGVFAVLQVANLFVLLAQYGEINSQHIVALGAVVLVGSLPLVLRWTVSGAVFAALYALLVGLGVGVSGTVSHTAPIGSGVDTPLLPIVVIACGLVAWLGSWRAVLGYVVCAVAFVWGLHAVSLLHLAESALAPDLAAALRLGFRQSATQATLALVVAGLVAAPFGHMLYAQLDRLEAAAEEARRAERLKSAFHANMNHEIRSPLSGIIGMSEVLGLTRLDTHQRKCVDLIAECGDGLLRILGEVLDVAKIDGGEMHLQAAPFDLRAMLEAQVALHAPGAHRRRLWLGLEYGEAEGPALPVRVVGDEARLRQVVGNLLGNAMKFTEAGGVRVAVAGRVEGHDLLATLTVQDTGCGVEESDRERIFERYAQSARGRAQGSGGTGLGLSIARDLVRLMGGDISIASRVGYGTAFSFTLRLPLAADTVVAKAA